MTTKKMQWIKLDIRMFDDAAIKLIDAQEDSDVMEVIWIKLLCLAAECNAGGALVLKGSIPYTPEMISTVINRSEHDVKRTLNALYSLGLIDYNDGIIEISGWKKHQVDDVEDANREKVRDRVRKHRSRSKSENKSESLSETPSVTTASNEVLHVTEDVTDACVTDVTGADVTCNVTCNALDKDIDKDKDIEKEKEIKKKKSADKAADTRTKQSQSSSRFQKPTKEEVCAFIDEKGYRSVDAERFWAYYESVGWRVGNKPMKSWQAAIASWESRNKQESKPKAQVNNYAIYD